MTPTARPGRVGITLAILYALAVDITYLSLLPTNGSFRPVWLYFIGMALAPWIGLLAWAHSWNVVATALFLAPNVVLGGILPFFLPLSLVVAGLALLQHRRTRVSQHSHEAA